MAKYEFKARHPLCSSECEPMSMKEVLALADKQCMEM